ncbi:hypothetical protein [Acidithiobacillus sp.]
MTAPAHTRIMEGDLLSILPTLPDNHFDSMEQPTMNNTGYTLREKLFAVRTLLLEIVLLVFIAAATVLLLGIISNLVAHFMFGYTWAWERTHADDWLLFWVIIATPLLLMGGLLWMVLRDEYQRILRMRMRKWSTTPPLKDGACKAVRRLG